jgi:hypothetical protein
LEANKESFSRLLNDLDFETIELSLKEPNIFQALSASRSELRHSSFLAYLLDPKKNHGLNDVFLKKFLQDIFNDKKSDRRDAFDVEFVNASEAEILREWRHIDILIKMPHDVVVIENKIDSKDHSNQLLKYKTVAEELFPDKRRHYVYLTPFGSPPTGENAPAEYIQYSYSSISAAFHKITHLYGERIPSKILHLIEDYIKIVRLEITMSDELNEMALKLYRSHKEALDFIFENRPDAVTILYPMFEDVIRSHGYVMGSKNKGYVRFTTPELARKLLSSGQGWPDKEQFLFEIDYYWGSNTKSISLKAIVSPGNDLICNAILDAVEKFDKYKTPSGAKWRVFYIKKYRFNSDEAINEDPKEIRKQIDKIILDAKPTIDTISTLIEHADIPML